MRVVARRSTHRLTRVVDDDVEARGRLEKPRAKRLQPGDVAKVHRVHVQPALPLVVVLLARVPRRRVRGETRGGDERRPGAQELQTNLETDLDARAREERRPPGQVRGEMAHAVVDLGAGGTQLRVKVMQSGESRLARVALRRAIELGMRGGGGGGRRRRGGGGGRRRGGGVVLRRASSSRVSLRASFGPPVVALVLVRRGFQRERDVPASLLSARVVLADRAVGNLRKVRHGGVAEKITQNVASDAAAAALAQLGEVSDPLQSQSRRVLVSPVRLGLALLTLLPLVPELPLALEVEYRRLPVHETLVKGLERAANRAEPRVREGADVEGGERRDGALQLGEVRGIVQVERRIVGGGRLEVGWRRR